MTTPADRELLVQALLDPYWFIPNLMKIEDKQRRQVGFVLNGVQTSVLDHIVPAGCRLNILKASQLGVTSIIAGFFLWDTITFPGTTTVIIAHEEFITQRLLHKTQVFYDSIPEQFKPAMHHSSSYEKTFPAINSTIYIGSARAYVFGRGEVIHNLLADEYAFWPDHERIMVPILQRVPMTGRIVKPSTPNGEENAFCYDYRASKRGEEVGNAVFTNLFLPWYLDLEYVIPRGSPFALERDREDIYLTAEEESLLRKFRAYNLDPSLDEGRIRWRRRKIEEMEQLRATGESAKFFFQEYPEDDEACFLAVGDMVYDSETLKAKANDCYRPTKSFLNFKVWYEPVDGVQYTVVVDPSQAKESKTAITVWDWVTIDGVEGQRECAQISGLFGPEVTAKLAMDVARHYNNAMLAIEANAHGLAVAVLIKDYPNLYYRRDVVSGKEGHQIGWLTTPKTKPFMVQSLTRALPGMITHDIDLIVEMRNMRYVGDKVVTAGDDDIHDTAAIAAAVRRPRQSGRGFVGVAGWSDKWGR